ncbi:MAG: SpoIIE family protein phosphatase [Clostridiales bacterium]|jgi:stage II sporulation protein E|nr:SpoIIE family protein phosphatase [Clostridiales bacterium]
MANIPKKRRAAAVGLKYSALLCLELLLCRAEIYGMRPFGAAFFMAAAFSGLPFAFFAPAYILGEGLASMSLYGTLNALVCAGVTLTGTLVRRRRKGAWRYLEAPFMAASQSGLIFLNGGPVSVLMLAVSVSVTVAYAYAAKTAIKPALIEKFRYRPLETELVCLAAVLLGAGLGLSRLRFYAFPLMPAASIFTVCLLGYITGFGPSLAAAFCFGLADALVSYNPALLCAPVFVAAISGIFIGAPRILTALSGVAAHTMFVFYFNADIDGALFATASLTAGGLLYAAIPQKLLAKAREYYALPAGKAAARYLVNKNRADTGARLLNGASVFEAMADVYGESCPPPPPPPNALRARCCCFCDNLPVCEKSGVTDSLAAFQQSAQRSGRVIVADIPAKISDNCVRLPRLVAAANELCEKAAAEQRQAVLEAAARETVSGQLRGVSDALGRMADAYGGNLTFDRKSENIIKEELSYRAVACAECLIAGDDVTLIIPTECLERKTVEKTVGRILRKSYVITGIDDTVLSGHSALVLSPRPRFDMVFGVSSLKKSGSVTSGDTHSFVKIDGRRLMVALSDGMGSGEAAKNVSETAIGLIEGFYRAGFSCAAVLNAVNGFLARNYRDSFSAADICVVDLETARADIIKLGSPATYIKRRDSVERIEGEGLPLGAVDAPRPSALSVQLNPGDSVVMASDGVADRFDGDKLAAAINNMRTTNVQAMAKAVLTCSLDNRAPAPSDDSTVVVARIIER